MATIAYLRISTQGQDLQKNKADILLYSNQHHLGQVQWVEEVVSTRVPWKQRKIAEVVDTLGKGDSLVVSEISRIGRSVTEVMVILSELMEKGVCVHVVKNNWVMDGSLQPKIFATVMSLAAEIEREFIRERTKEALRERKRQGIRLGRPRGSSKSKLDRYREEIVKLLENGSTKTFIAQRYKTTPANLHIWIKKRGITTMKSL